MRASRRRFDGCAEIGSKGRYYRGLAAALDIRGPCFFIDERAPSFSPADILERGQVRPLTRHLPLNDYAPSPRMSSPTPRWTCWFAMSAGIT
ncbi:hypothetical protein [Chromobacterium alticapitis]|uniref:Uncharacterized protein n=1 Tax=Chromobacterium alticapitis TaxID=2073169 RepID=A0A2S5DIT1_9NEIS|nr:hypothetical protein [Chromobacterium alticapitis]POZ62898.1 hypothetical protein C2I19_05805 [Chromobacterium alticapitis]